MPEVVGRAAVETEEAIKATPGGQVLSLVEAQVPLANSIRRVAGAVELVC